MGFNFGLDTSSYTGISELNLLLNSQPLAQSIERLSSGLRINSAADDPAGLAISQSLTAQMNGLNQAVQNDQNNLSLAQTASGALTQEMDILQSMRTLAVQAGNGSYSGSSLSAIQAQMDQYASQLTKITNTTSFNGQNLLSGAFQNQIMQLGANAGDTMSLSINPMDAASLGVAGSTASITTGQNSANVQSLSSVGSGLLGANTGEQYKITSTGLTGDAANGTMYNVAGTAITNAGGASTGNASAALNQGGETMSVAGTNTSGMTQTYHVQVASVNANGAITSVRYTTTTSGTPTWTTVNVAAGGTFNVGNGLTAAFNNYGAATAQTGDQFTFTVANTASVGTGTITAGTNVNIGATTNVTGPYTGTTNTQYAVKAAALDSNNNVVGVTVSTDGGKTFSSTITYTTTPGYNPLTGMGNIGATGTTAAFTLGNGLTFNWTAGTGGNADQAAINGDTYYFNAVARGQTAQYMQLSDTNTKFTGYTTNLNQTPANIGMGTLLNSGQTSATVGINNQTITANFNAPGTSGAVQGGSTTFTVSTPQAATVANGVVLTQASANAGPNIMTTAAANSAITAISNAINQVTAQQGQLGAVQNRLADAINNTLIASENTNQANGNIMNANIAQEMINFTTSRIIQQSAISVLYQASQLPSLYLKLFG
jgi:flagellin